MTFYSVDGEVRSMSVIEEPKTLAICARMMGTAIGRWLISGADLPDWQASDGVSEYEGALQFE